MKQHEPPRQGIVIAVLHVGLVASLGAKLLYDRDTLPRAWTQAAPYDPDMPIRGRYVSLQLTAQPRGIGEPKPGPGWQPSQAVSLRSEVGWPAAVPMPVERGYDPAARHLRFIQRQGEMLAVLDKPVPFFIRAYPGPIPTRTG